MWFAQQCLLWACLALAIAAVWFPAHWIPLVITAALCLIAAAIVSNIRDDQRNKEQYKHGNR